MAAGSHAGAVHGRTTLSPPPPPPPPPPPLDGITTMPPAVVCSFVGEGSANAVFCVRQVACEDVSIEGAGADADADADALATHLLRIPKAGPGVGPTTCVDHQQYYAAVLRPLLGAQWLVGQHLVRGVVATGVHAVLDRLLADLDRSCRRRPDWVSTRVAPGVDVALLVEDMTAPCPRSTAAAAAAATTTVTIQFKPKWLVQSPSAPPAARRCRTCALSAASSAAPDPGPDPGANGNGAANGSGSGAARDGHVGRSKKAHKVKPCPLVLVAPPPASPAEEAALDAALWHYVCQHLGSSSSTSSAAPATPATPPSPPLALLKARPAIVRWLRSTPLFRHLAAIQAEFDPHGALAVDDGLGLGHGHGHNSAELDRLQTAMTLRDCTCYLRVTVEGSPAAAATPPPPSSASLAASAPASASVSSSLPSTTISAQLGDLDRKDGRRKLARWQAQERALLAGGFYLGTEVPRRQTRCWLERAGR